MATTTLPLNEITGWTSFHAVSAKVFGFPNFYGCNNNAWIDCLSDLTEETGMSKFFLTQEEQLTIHLPDFEEFSRLNSEIASAFLECTAVVNRRHIEQTGIPRLVLVPA